MDELLEREAELAALLEAARGLPSGRGCLVLVGGEAGIGKTTLVRALRERLGGGTAFLSGACEPLSVPVPLAPLRELAEAAGQPDLAGPEPGDRLLLASGLLEALAARAPAVAVVEDAHWADAATLDVLRLLARRVEEAPVAVVVTYRDDEAAANPELSRLLGDLAGRPAVRRLLLRPLSPAAVRELAAPAGVDPAGLARVTGGNPFLVVEAIAAGGGLPATVRDATLARAARLGPAARQAVEAAAVIGQRVAPALLEAVAPGSGAAVEEALARGVIVADGPVLGFRHELLREAIESSLSPPRRAELHGRVVAALAAQETGPDHARLAHHAELAGAVADACRYAALAAADAERVGALRETSLQAGRALRLGAGLDGAERVDLLIRYAHAANFASTRLEDAVEAAEEAVALAAELGDRVGQGRGLVALAYALWSCDRVAEAHAAAGRAVAVLEGAGNAAELARAQSTLVRMEATTSDPGGALELGPRALELAAEAGLEQVRLDVEISLGLARAHLGDPEAPAVLAAAARAARRAGFPIQTVRVHVNLVVAALALRRHALVDEATAEALAIFDEHQTTIPANAVEFYRARSLLDRGRWREAEAILTAERTMAAEGPTLRAVAGLLRVRRGDAGAGRLVHDAWTEIRDRPESSRHGVIRNALVEAAWLRGDRAGALRELRAAEGTPAFRFARTGGELALWGHRHGLALEPAAGAPEPVLLELAGDWRGAVRAWRELGCPYDAALAALPGDDAAARAAVAALHELGAEGAVRAFARERAAAGARAPRGPRRSTRAHPAGLTRREQEVLESLATGATNPAIAAALHLSERTVAHHVSSILRKLGAPTRLAAVEAARARGLLPEDGQPPAQT
ncbi:MAG TPA: AAA family ATPase [Gaiellaceae bacterium]|nr:AAA family ATPase [Gaiellaceae bacterium]